MYIQQLFYNSVKFLLNTFQLNSYKEEFVLIPISIF